MGSLATVRKVGNKTAEPEVCPFITVLRMRVLSPPYDGIYGRLCEPLIDICTRLGEPPDGASLSRMLRSPPLTGMLLLAT